MQNSKKFTEDGVNTNVMEACSGLRNLTFRLQDETGIIYPEQDDKIIIKSTRGLGQADTRTLQSNFLNNLHNSKKTWSRYSEILTNNVKFQSSDLLSKRVAPNVPKTSKNQDMK